MFFQDLISFFFIPYKTFILQAWPKWVSLYFTDTKITYTLNDTISMRTQNPSSVIFRNLDHKINFAAFTDWSFDSKDYYMENVFNVIEKVFKKPVFVSHF